MKRIFSILLIFTLFLSGCGQKTPAQPAESTEVPEESAYILPEKTEQAAFLCEYSNLTSEAARQEVEEVLKGSGVSDQRREMFWSHVEQFNSAVDSSLLVGDFETRDILFPAYDSYDYQDAWLEKYPDFSGYNCRITAFGLFGDCITAAEDAEIRDNDLFMDLESLESDPAALLNEGDADTFRRIFSTVPTDNSTDIDLHMENIRRDWADRGIMTDENTPLSLVTVWFHNQWSETENELFIGHVGVLVESENGLYFIEKVAFQEPYQVLKLRDRQQLTDYLTARYGVQWGQETAQPFIVFS